MGTSSASGRTTRLPPPRPGRPDRRRTVLMAAGTRRTFQGASDLMLPESVGDGERFLAAAVVPMSARGVRRLR
jgi:hypothetical protein